MNIYYQDIHIITAVFRLFCIVYWCIVIKSNKMTEPLVKINPEAISRLSNQVTCYLPDLGPISRRS